MEPDLILIVAFAALLVGLGKGGLGAALAGSATPFLSLMMTPAEAVGFILPMLILGDLLALRLYWGAWDKYQLRLLLPASIPGLLIGTYLLTNLPTDTMRVVLGIFTLIIAFYKIIEPRLQQFSYTPRPWHGQLAGGVTGVGSALANAGGPTFSAYLILQGLEPRYFMGTTTVFFVIANVIRLPNLYLAGLLNADGLRSALVFLPVVVIGIYAGHALINRINTVLFNRIVVVILIGAGLLLLF